VIAPRRLAARAELQKLSAKGEDFCVAIRAEQNGVIQSLPPGFDAGFRALNQSIARIIERDYPALFAEIQAEEEAIALEKLREQRAELRETARKAMQRSLDFAAEIAAAKRARTARAAALLPLPAKAAPLGTRTVSAKHARAEVSPAELRATARKFRAQTLGVRLIEHAPRFAHTIQFALKEFSIPSDEAPDVRLVPPDAPILFDRARGVFDVEFNIAYIKSDLSDDETSKVIFHEIGHAHERLRGWERNEYWVTSRARDVYDKWRALPAEDGDTWAVARHARALP